MMSEEKPDEAPPSYEESTHGTAPPYPGATGPPYAHPGAGPPQGYMPPPPQQYAPPPQQYAPPPQPQGPHTTVIVTSASLRQTSVQMQCPSCNSLIMTETEYRVGGMVWLICGIILIVGCWVGCCLIPFCIDDLKDVSHSCPSCCQKIGTYHRLG